jgi:hypothetical protein
LGANGPLYINISLSILFIISIFLAAFLLGRKDMSGYTGLNYHLVTYLIINGIAYILAFSSYPAWPQIGGLEAVLPMTIIWGIGLLFHAGGYLFFFKKKKIGRYDRDSIFQ